MGAVQAGFLSLYDREPEYLLAPWRSLEHSLGTTDRVQGKGNTLSNYWKPGAPLSALGLWVPHDCPLSLGSIPGLG